MVSFILSGLLHYLGFIVHQCKMENNILDCQLYHLYGAHAHIHAYPPAPHTCSATAFASATALASPACKALATSSLSCSRARHIRHRYAHIANPANIACLVQNVAIATSGFRCLHCPQPFFLTQSISPSYTIQHCLTVLSAHYQRFFNHRHYSHCSTGSNQHPIRYNRHAKVHMQKARWSGGMLDEDQAGCIRDAYALKRRDPVIGSQTTNKAEM